MSSSVRTPVVDEPGPAAVPPSTEATRRHLSERQAQTVQRLVEAAVDELREQGYDGLTVRNVARRAGVAPATAYNYFTSREHLVTEVFWRRLQALPESRLDRRRTAPAQVTRTMTDLALLVADEPELASACTVAMLATDPDVKLLRDRIGLEWRRRLARSLGESSDPAVLTTLEFAVSGALLQAGMGHMSYDELPERLARTVELVVR
ncbi:MAG: TetR/AcrR family transcriptional regulator [Microthrixaceae bacterium]